MLIFNAFCLFNNLIGDRKLTNFKIWPFNLLTSQGGDYAYKFNLKRDEFKNIMFASFQLGDSIVLSLKWKQDVDRIYIPGFTRHLSKGQFKGRYSSHFELEEVESATSRFSLPGTRVPSWPLMLSVGSLHVFPLTTWTSTGSSGSLPHRKTV